MGQAGKRIKNARKKLSEIENYSIEEVVSQIKETSGTKFEETLDIAMNLNVDPRHADQMVRGTVSLPSGTGKSVRVAVFARGAKAEEAKEAGADIVGAEDLVESIQSGTIDFERCIATPDLMPLVGRLGKILGPRNLMPNPRVGTVTPDVSDAIANAKGGEIQFRVDKTGNVHGGIGKISFDSDKLAANVKAFIDGVKGKFIKKISLSSTMGPSIEIDPMVVGGNS